MLMTQHFDYCPRASEGDNQSVGSSAPVASRCFPGGYNVKLYISRGMVSMVVTGFFAQCLDSEFNSQIFVMHVRKLIFLTQHGKVSGKPTILMQHTPLYN